MTKADWIWMPHAGHCVIKEKCQFHLCTYVNGYLVSTIGEYWPDRDVRKILRSEDKNLLTLRGDALDHYYRKKYGFEEVGDGRRYETMVFIAKKRLEDDYQCCPYQIAEYISDAFAGYNTADEATKGHMKFCYAFDEKPFPKNKLDFNVSDAYVKDNTITNAIDFQNAVEQFNYNVEAIKCHMSSQCLQNELFLERDKTFKSQMENMETRMSEQNTKISLLLDRIGSLENKMKTKVDINVLPNYRTRPMY